MNLLLFWLTFVSFTKQSISHEIALNRIVRIVKTSSKNYTSKDVERQGPFGGITAFPGEFPFLVSLRFFRSNGDAKLLHHFCSGSLLNDRWVVTSAGCVINDGLELFLVAGEGDLTEQVIPVRRIVIHPEFNRSSGFADLALVAPEYPFELNSHVASVGLAGVAGEIGDLVAIPGWGSISTLSSELLKVYLPLVSCPESTPKATICILEANDEDYDDFERSFCSVDLGSPAVKVNPNREVILLGIVSQPPRDCFNPSEPLLLTDIAVFQPWIIAQTVMSARPGIHRQNRFRSRNDRNAADVTKLSATPMVILLLLQLFGL